MRLFSNKAIFQTDFMTNPRLPMPFILLVSYHERNAPVPDSATKRNSCDTQPPGSASRDNFIAQCPTMTKKDDGSIP